MNYLKSNSITKEEFNNIKENEVMFITHPGRMGDEDGSTFILLKENVLIPYRISGWMYGKDKPEITIDDMYSHFSKWVETLEKREDENYKGKYKYYYMGFGNSLCVDKSISDIFDKYLDKWVKKLELDKESDDSDAWYKKYIPDCQVISNDYSVKYNSWQKAAIDTAKELKYKIELFEDEKI